MSTAATATSAQRITSIDALRGFVMFTMIFVNDLAGVPNGIVPDWMVHFSKRHSGDVSGMTFVDVVFPAFLFIVGMSIPFGLGSRLAKGEPVWKTFWHVLARSLTLLAIGILMVNLHSAAPAGPGWHPTLWETSIFVAAILAACSFLPRGAGAASVKFWQRLSLGLRMVGFGLMLYLAFAFRSVDNKAIITLSPFNITHSYFGILGEIGLAYFVAATVFLLFRNQRTALLGCVVLLMCLYPADAGGLFSQLWLAQHVKIGGMLGSRASIAVAGVLLASILVTPDTATLSARVRFTLQFIAGFAGAAILVNSLYGINKGNATPSWCLWSCAIAATAWLIFYFFSDVKRIDVIAKPWSVAGQNVLLAYLLSEMMVPFFHLISLGGFNLGVWYSHMADSSLTIACVRAIACSIITLALTALLNRLGLRLKL